MKRADSRRPQAGAAEGSRIGPRHAAAEPEHRSRAREGRPPAARPIHNEQDRACGRSGGGPCMKKAMRDPGLRSIGECLTRGRPCGTSLEDPRICRGRDEAARADRMRWLRPSDPQMKDQK
ncbi:hypothetical protein EBL87_12845 [Cereibacter sphaeroides]|nr:hypothetical protein EBL87_12845 [Cereibacter sphaeroides]AZB67478.1 hypothetical protein EBL86_03405 [Cereibacter sphaeroides]